MKINIYKSQVEIEKTFEVKNYDLMYGTVQDVLDILDKGIPDTDDEDGLFRLIVDNRGKLEDLLLDIFEPVGMVKEDLRKIKLKELIPIFIDLFNYVSAAFNEKN
jgi:hypothetical protein